MPKFLRLPNHVRYENAPSPLPFPLFAELGEDCTPEHLRKLANGKELCPPKGFRGPWIAWMHELLGIGHADYPNRPIIVHRFVRRGNDLRMVVSWTDRETPFSGQANEVEVEHCCAAIRLSEAEFVAVCNELMR